MKDSEHAAFVVLVRNQRMSVFSVANDHPAARCTRSFFIPNVMFFLITGSALRQFYAMNALLQKNNDFHMYTMKLCGAV